MIHTVVCCAAKKTGVPHCEYINRENKTAISHTLHTLFIKQSLITGHVPGFKNASSVQKLKENSAIYKAR